MKTYEEMASNVIERVEKHNKIKQNQKKTFMKIIASVLCVAAVTVLSIGVFNGRKSKQISVKQENRQSNNLIAETETHNIVISDKKTKTANKKTITENKKEQNGLTESENEVNETITEKPSEKTTENKYSVTGSETGDCCRFIGAVNYNGYVYLQKDGANSDAYTKGKHLGRAVDFDGYYNDVDKRYIEFQNGDELYASTESEDVLIIELKNSQKLIFIKVDNQ